MRLAHTPIQSLSTSLLQSGGGDDRDGRLGGWVVFVSELSSLKSQICYRTPLSLCRSERVFAYTPTTTAAPFPPSPSALTGDSLFFFFFAESGTSRLSGHHNTYPSSSSKTLLITQAVLYPANSLRSAPGSTRTNPLQHSPLPCDR